MALEFSMNGKAAEQKLRPRKPRVALIVDVRNWAFHNIAKQLVKNLSEYYDFEIITAVSNEHPNRIFLRLKDFDLAHFFYRELLNYLESDYSRKPLDAIKIDYCELEEYISSCKIITRISDHHFLDQKDIQERIDLFNLKCDSYYTSSRKLFDIYSNIEEYRQPWGDIANGVDLELFEPANLARFTKSRKNEYVIGWAGNSHHRKASDLKGLHTVLNPAIDELLAEGYRIKRYYADRVERQLAHEDMPLYYSKIDIFVCASLTEGTPNPVLEAMACGVPVISTDVGNIPEVFGDKQKEFILGDDRCKDELKMKIARLIEEPKLLGSLSRENLKQIQSWNWKIRCSKFKNLFDDCLNSD